MRRGINIRKKKKIISNKINQKALKLLILLITVLIVCILIYFVFIQDIFIEHNLEQDSLNFSTLNDDIPFQLNKIILFSSATAESDSTNQQLTLDISQYCDIGIYLSRLKDESITISNLYIDNIIMSSPEIGTPYLYKKNINDLGKCSFDEKNIVSDIFNFNIVDSEQDINYDNFEIYNNATSPISLGFINKNIKTNFFATNTEIIYNGLLLRDAAIPPVSLKCNISFRLNIITNSNEHYLCNINFDVPLEHEGNSIYDIGYITKEFKSDEVNKFIRIK